MHIHEDNTTKIISHWLFKLMIQSIKKNHLGIRSETKALITPKEYEGTKETDGLN